MNAKQMNWDMGAEQHQTNPFVMIHRSLRGKYILVIVLGLLFGVVGGAMGYMSRNPMYASTGIVRIKPKIDKVLYESEQSTVPQMFSSIVNTHAQLIASAEVVSRALESDTMISLSENRGVFFDDPEVVKDNLRVRTDGRAQELIRVSYEHEDPLVSEAVVKSVLAAYLELHGSEGSIRDPARLRLLKDLQQEHTRVIRDSTEQINDIMRMYNTENLTPLVDESREEVRRVGNELQLVNGYIEVLTPRDEGEEVSENTKQLFTPEQIAINDPRMKALLTQLEALIQNRDQMMISEGLREEHRDVRRITKMIEGIESAIEERRSEFVSGEDLVLYDEQGKPVASLDELLIRKVDLTSAESTLKADSEKIFNHSLELNRLRELKTREQESLQRVEERLTLIETESSFEANNAVNGRITIAQAASRASMPTSDPRIKMAGAGFVGLGSIPVLVILVIGHLSHRVNYSDDEVLTGAQAGIVGMLPDLGNSLEDQELASASAFAVHQIRSQLQIKGADSDTRVYGVTSPAPGDGKTSLIIAMGLSFAESGSRTLLLDLDFIGRGLSVHFGHSRAPSLADRLVEADEVAELIHETEFPGLSILPAGYGDDLRVSKLSPKSVEALLAPLKERFDTILIDTGPILGSVEAAFVAPQADGVLLVVGRGQFKPLIKKAIDQIHAVDGKIAATIFNRASMHEIRHSTSSMSVHFSRQFSRQQQEIEQFSGSRGGPVAGTLFADRRSSSSEPKYRKAEP